MRGFNRDLLRLSDSRVNAVSAFPCGILYYIYIYIYIENVCICVDIGLPSSNDCIQSPRDRANAKGVYKRPP